MADTLDPIRWDIVEEHLDEAEFLFTLWLGALDSASYRFPRLGRGLEQRLVAHLDGLAIGGEAVAERLLWPALAPEADELTRVASAASALVIEADPMRIDRLLGVLPTLEAGPCRDGIVVALGSAARPELATRVLSAAEKADDPARAALVAILARRGAAPGPACTAWLDRGMASEDPATRLAVAGVAATLPRAGALRIAERMLGDRDPAVQREALGAGIVHGSTSAYAFATDVARGRIASSPETIRAAMTVVAIAGDPGCVEFLYGRASVPELREHVIWALGFTGRTEAVDRLLPWLADDEVAALTAEAIGGITGLGRDQSELWKPAAPPPEMTLDELAADVPPENLDEEPVEDELPEPIAEAFVRAWTELRPKLDPRQRFHEGRPLVHARSYADVLGLTTLRRRHTIALELAMRSRRALYVPTRGLSAMQRPFLAAIGNAGPIDGARPYARIS